MTMVSKWEYSHDPDVVIKDLPERTSTIRKIAKEHVKFFFSVPAVDHPLSYHELPFDRRKELDDHQQTFHGGGEDDPNTLGIWHLLGANLIGFYKTHLPVTRDWAILTSPWIAFSSRAEYPRLAPSSPIDDQLRDLVKKDVDGVSTLYASINHETITPIRIADSVPDVDIGPNNVFGIAPESDVEVFFDGYFALLKPLPLGDNLIESIGLGVNFENSVRYAVYARR
jgi:hypothetical protein